MNLKPLLLAIAFFPLAATAGVVTSISETAPDDAYISVTQGTSNSIWKNNSPNSGGIRDIGQTFKLTEEMTFSAITFKVFQNRSGSYGSEFRLSILPFADAGATSPNGAALHQENGFLPSVAIPQGHFLTFTLSNPITLAPGQYGVQLSLLNIGTANDMNFYTGRATNYPDGAGFHHTNTGPDLTMIYEPAGGVNGADFNFFIHAAAIPEPTSLSLGLLLLGGGAAWHLRRRMSTR